MRTLKSPVTSSFNTQHIESIDSSQIINAYAGLNIDVTGYLRKVRSIDLYLCKDTGYMFYYPPSLVADSSFYDLLQETDHYYCIKNEHRRAYKYIKENDRVLEIGCGSGLFLDSLRTKTPFIQGLELSDNALAKAQNIGLDVCKSTIESFAKLHLGHFDVVCCFQVLEHVYEVNSFISSALKCLPVGGKLIIGVPNNNPYLYRYDKFHALNLPPHHIGLWNRVSLESLPKYFPLELVKIAVDNLSTPGEHIRFCSIQSCHYAQAGNTIKALAWKSLLSVRPYRLGIVLRKLVTRAFEGRNVLAVYKKL